MGLITVGMDESVCAADALRWAVAEGETRGWPVHAVLAWTFLRQHHADRSSRHDPEYAEADAAAALEAYVADAIGTEGAAALRLEVVTERAPAALLEASSGSSLLVVGSHGYGGIAGLVMGSVSQACLHKSTIPVAVIRRSDEGRAGREVTPGKVVVGVDGSDTARRALEWGIDRARASDGWVEVVHSWMLPAAYGYPTLDVPDLSTYEESARSLVADLIESVDASGLSQPVESVVTGGTSAAGLLTERSEDAELLVVGSRGIGGFSGMVIGSVAHHLAHHAPCPLVVIPAERD